MCMCIFLTQAQYKKVLFFLGYISFSVQLSDHSPMLRVTVMMFSDIVESVMLLNDEDWR